jgi:hypothetical protein
LKGFEKNLQKTPSAEGIPCGAFGSFSLGKQRK